MKQSRLTPGRTLWLGPKSLAIVSCALALLAAQPWPTSTAATATPAAVRQMTSTQIAPVAALPAIAPREIRATAAIAARRQLVRDDTHSQFRATWLIFQHLLAAQLAPLPSPTNNPLDLTLFQPVPFTLAPASPTVKLSYDLYRSPPPPSERSYAIAHHLLAPPC